MADGNDLLELCTAGNSPDSSGPPIKRLRGGNVDEGSSMGTSPFEDVAGLQAAEDSQTGVEDWSLCPATHLAYLRDYHPGSEEGTASHPFSSDLVSGSLETGLGSRVIPIRGGPRSTRPQVPRVGMWGGEPSAFFDVVGEPLDLASDSRNAPDNLHWARKSQRQTRNPARLPAEGPDFLRNSVPELPFRRCCLPPAPLSSSPPSEVFQFARDLASPPRMRHVTRSGQGCGGPGPCGEARRFNSWNEIWEPEDDVLELGIMQASSARPGQGSGRPSSLENSRLRGAPSFFELHPVGEPSEGNRFPSIPQRPSRGLDARRAAILEAAREQSLQALQQARDPIQRHRSQRAQRRASLREEFGALMNALGILHTPEGGPDRPREARSSMVAMHMQEAMMGIARSGLPPQLLFTDRDFTSDDYEWLCRLDEGVENRKGADEETINKLPTVAFTDADFEDEEEVIDYGDEDDVAEIEGMIDPGKRCPICLDHFGNEDMLRIMPCKHKYHKGCLDKWLKIKATCPICNLNIKGD